MPLYDCPECGAQLKVAAAVAPGKKIRCPKCEEVFAPVPAKKAAKAAPAAPAKDARNAELEDAGGYGLIGGTADHGDDAGKDTFSPLRDRFERSARGPALILVVKPSDWLLRTGVMICVAAIFGGLWATWPMIFKVEEVQPEDKMAKWKPQSTEGRRFKELSEDERNERFVYLGGCVFQFLWGAVICVGASNMHTLSSYPLAMIGAIMAFIGPGVPAGIYFVREALKDNDPYFVFISVLLMLIPGVPMAIWCIVTLRKKEVLDGFAAEKPEDY